MTGGVGVGCGAVVSGAVLVVAKAPVPGLAKTRLAARVGPDAAADIAASALLDLLAAVRSSGARLLVAMTGELAAAARSVEVATALAGAELFAQRGDAFADRLASAHADARTLVGPGEPILQVGMDTPQLNAALLSDSLRIAAGRDAVLGPADDGGWWALSVRDPAWAEALRGVPMSQADTGALTAAALEGEGVEVTMLAPLRDVDTWDDAEQVARTAPAGRFAAAVAAAARAF
ncbi:DUF2064 domain-containing protein [soil metagenome]